MIECPRCLVWAHWLIDVCPECDYSPPRADGFLSWVPYLDGQRGGFDPEYFEILASLEAQNFWFQARNALICWFLKRYLLDLKDYLEVGCGTGFVLSAVQGLFPEARLTASEYFVEGLKVASRRVHGARFVQMDARKIPYREAFDVIGAFDVLEHIEQDDVVLSELYGSLKPGGVLLLTVPQHTWLWSILDDKSYHYRRYEASRLHQLLWSKGFEVVRSTSFVSLLLPLMLLSRKRQTQAVDTQSELKVGTLLNGILGAVMGVERALIRYGINFTHGGSRLVLARKLPL